LIASVKSARMDQGSPRRLPQGSCIVVVLAMSNRRPGCVGLIVVLALLASFSVPAGETGFDGWEGAFQILLRGVYLAPQNHRTSQSSEQLHVDGGFYGELSAAWFMTPTIAMELSLGQVSSFNSKIEQPGAAIDSGPIRMMPNTWTLQYHLAPDNTVRP